MLKWVPFCVKEDATQPPAGRCRETRCWRQGSALTLRAELRKLRKQSALPEHVPFLLGPDSRARDHYFQRIAQSKLHLPPCRVLWVGDVVAAPDSGKIPHVEVLVEGLSRFGEFGKMQIVALPLTFLRFFRVGQVLQGLESERLCPGNVDDVCGPMLAFSDHVVGTGKWMRLLRRRCD